MTYTEAMNEDIKNRTAYIFALQTEYKENENAIKELYTYLNVNYDVAYDTGRIYADQKKEHLTINRGRDGFDYVVFFDGYLYAALKTSSYTVIDATDDLDNANILDALFC